MTRLVIGKRRRTSRLRFAVAGVVAFVTLLFVSHSVYQRLVAYPVPPSTFDIGSVYADGGRLIAPSGRLEYREGIRIAHLEGSSATIGYTHGRLLADEISGSLGRFEQAIDTPRTESLIASLRRRWRWRTLDDGIPGHQLVEMSALASGAGLSSRFEDLLRLQAVHDVRESAPTTLATAYRSSSRALSAVARLHDIEGDRIVVASLRSLPIARGRPTTPTLYIVRADNALPIATLQSPGAIAIDAGINARGIAIVVHPGVASDVERDRIGQPAGLIAREVLAQASTVDEAANALKASNILGAARFLIVDGAARKHIVIEKSPTRFARLDGESVVTEVFKGKPFADDPRNERSQRLRPVAARRQRAKRLLKSSDTTEAMARLLRDRSDNSGAQLSAGHRHTIDDPFSELAFVLDASRMLIWISEGPGTSGTFRGIDLRARLADSSKAATPSDIEAAPTEHRQRSIDIIRARAGLEEALSHADQNDVRRASEHAERAVAQAPNFPMARWLAGELASRAGNADRSHAHLAAYLSKPDSPALADMARARMPNRVVNQSSRTPTSR